MYIVVLFNKSFNVCMTFCGKFTKNYQTFQICLFPQLCIQVQETIWSLHNQKLTNKYTNVTIIKIHIFFCEIRQTKPYAMFAVNEKVDHNLTFYKQVKMQRVELSFSCEILKKFDYSVTGIWIISLHSQITVKQTFKVLAQRYLHPQHLATQEPADSLLTCDHLQDQLDSIGCFSIARS